MIQTFYPENYAIVAAQKQDYLSFYQQEIEYRRMMFYPPIWNMLVIWCMSEQEAAANGTSEAIASHLQQVTDGKHIYVIGPADATIAKINDTYRKVIYLKTTSYEELVAMKDKLEIFITKTQQFANVVVQFDFNPMNGF